MSADQPAATTERTINFDAAREIAGELQRGLVTTATGYKHITNLSKRGATEAFRQAGEIMEALLDDRERLRGGLTAVYLVAVQEDDAATAATLAADVAKKALDG